MIYTKTGDRGTTSLVGGSRVLKCSDRVEAYGDLDELVSYLGLCREYLSQAESSDLLQIQNVLFNIDSIIACEKEEFLSKLPEVKQDDVKFLESRIDAMNEVVPPLRQFIIPGGDLTSSHLNVARTICRRCERKVVKLSQDSQVQEIVLQYINRLSDYLFMLSRYVILKQGKEETFWQP
jgi:cob(I)alamin adenosyltransferase